MFVCVRVCVCVCVCVCVKERERVREFSTIFIYLRQFLPEDQGDGRIIVFEGVLSVLLLLSLVLLLLH